jgi:hypothetical protein
LSTDAPQPIETHSQAEEKEKEITTVTKKESKNRLLEFRFSLLFRALPLSSRKKELLILGASD